jgi:hypothetical protein
VAEWIQDPAQTPAVLISHLRCRRGAGLDRPRKHRVGIIDHQQGPACRAADSRRAIPRSHLSAGRNPEGGIPYPQLRDDLIPRTDLMENPGTEGHHVERDCRSSRVDPQFRLYIRHA